MIKKSDSVCSAIPMATVANVKKSSAWYQKVLGCKSDHGGDEYDQIVSNGRMVLQLHAWDIDHHHDDLLGKKNVKSRGNGLVLWFYVEDIDAALKRIKKAKAKVLKPVGINPNANHREIWLQDLDGYTVVVSGRYGDI